jgi:16S rRNA processing protein RimM
MINKSDYTKIGTVVKTHGIEGDLVLNFDQILDEATFEEMESIFLDIEGGLVPFFIEEISTLSESRILVHLKWHDDEKEASALKGYDIYIPKNMVYNNEMPDMNIVGFRVQDTQYGALGSVQELFEMPQQLMMQILREGREVLIPFNDTIVKEIIPEENVIIIEAPDGLLDLYLSESDDLE